MNSPSLPTIKVTPGEWFDRVTILEIKSHKFRGAKQDAVLSQLADLRGDSGGEALQLRRRKESPLKRLVAQLLHTNSKLWDIEDAIRALDAKVFPLALRNAVVEPHPGEGPELADEVQAYLELARSVYVTNDERSRLKREIDEFFEVQSEVKEYAAYNEQP